MALNSANIGIKNYYSSEIDKSPLQIQNYNFSADSTFHQIGDVTKVKGADYTHIQLIIGGSPCLQLSSINTKDRSGLAGKDSSLFYEFVRIIKEIKAAKPNGDKLYILLENVASMPNSEKNKITLALSEALGEDIKPIKIDSALCSPSHRRRYYWTNIPNITQPSPTGIKLQDILVNGFADRDKGNVILSSNVTLTNGIKRYYQRNIGNIIFKDKEFAELQVEQKLLSYPSILNKSRYKGKSRSATDEYEFGNGCYRLPSVLEYERMMTIPDGYVSNVLNVSKTEKIKTIGLSFTVDVISHLLKPLNEILLLEKF